MRTLVMGDIHGAAKALLQCLERSNFDKDNDTLIFLGDVADGWGQVPECVEELLSIKNLIAIRGNHDKWAEDWMTTAAAPNFWLTQGGQATYDAYIPIPEIMNIHRDKFFKKQHNFYIDDSDRAFVHGGYISFKGLGHEGSHSTYYWDRELWMIALSGKSLIGNIPKRLRPHSEIFIGHTATTNWKEDTPMNACNVWNLDTGAGFDGKLTIMDVETKEYWQSDNVKELYPDEVGR